MVCCIPMRVGCSPTRGRGTPTRMCHIPTSVCCTPTGQMTQLYIVPQGNVIPLQEQVINSQDLVN